MWMLTTLAVAQASPSTPTAEDQAVQKMIRSQLDAFERGDAQVAFEHVSPGLREQFGTPGRFLEATSQVPLRFTMSAFSIPVAVNGCWRTSIGRCRPVKRWHW